MVFEPRGRVLLQQRYMITLIIQFLSLFYQACDVDRFWNFLEGQFPAGIYANEWYNKQKVKRQEFIGNKMSILLGMPRLRQLRIQKGYLISLCYKKCFSLRRRVQPSGQGVGLVTQRSRVQILLPATWSRILETPLRLVNLANWPVFCKLGV